jgi:hypothetical protein
LNISIKLIRVVVELLDVSTMGHWDNNERARVKRDVEKRKAQNREKEYQRLKKLVSLAGS